MSEQTKKRAKISRRKAGLVIEPPTPRPIEPDHPAIQIFKESLKNITTVPQYRSTEDIQVEYKESIELKSSDSNIDKVSIPQYRSTEVPQSITAKETPVIEEMSTSPIPATPFYKKPNATADEVDRTLTPAESKVFDHLLRLSIGFGKETCQIRVATLMERTGYRSDKTIREAINGLISKCRIERVTHHNSPKGDLYRILIYSGKSDNTPVPQYRSTGVNNYRSNDVTPVKNTGHLNKIMKEINDFDHDPITALLKTTFPNLAQDKIEEAKKQIENIIVQEIKNKKALASQEPASPNFFIECLKRSFSTNNNAVKQSRKQQLEKIVSEVRELNVGGNQSFSDFIEQVKQTCITRGVKYDNDIINQILKI